MLRATTILICAIVLCGCAAAFVPVRANPEATLEDVRRLAFVEGRPLPAEWLIKDAIAKFQARGDEHWLGHAYRQYAEFLFSPAVEKFERHYRSEGHFVMDPTITFDNRREKADEYFRRALSHYAEAESKLAGTEQLDELTNLYYNMARVNIRLGAQKQGCLYYDRAAAANASYLQKHPGTKLQGTTVNRSLEDQITIEKRSAGCSQRHPATAAG